MNFLNMIAVIITIASVFGSGLVFDRNTDERIRNLRLEIKGDTKEIRNELRVDLGELRGDLNELRGDLNDVERRLTESIERSKLTQK